MTFAGIGVADFVDDAVVAILVEAIGAGVAVGAGMVARAHTNREAIVDGAVAITVARVGQAFLGLHTLTVAVVITVFGVAGIAEFIQITLVAGAFDHAVGGGAVAVTTAGADLRADFVDDAVVVFGMESHGAEFTLVAVEGVMTETLDHTSAVITVAAVVAGVVGAGLVDDAFLSVVGVAMEAVFARITTVTGVSGGAGAYDVAFGCVARAMSVAAQLVADFVDLAASVFHVESVRAGVAEGLSVAIFAFAGDGAFDDFTLSVAGAARKRAPGIERAGIVFSMVASRAGVAHGKGEAFVASADRFAFYISAGATVAGAGVARVGWVAGVDDAQGGIVRVGHVAISANGAVFVAVLLVACADNYAVLDGTDAVAVAGGAVACRIGGVAISLAGVAINWRVASGAVVAAEGGQGHGQDGHQEQKMGNSHRSSSLGFVTILHGTVLTLG